MPLCSQSAARDGRVVKRYARRLAGLLAVTGLVVLSTVLTSCQQVRDLTTTFATQHVAGPSLEGTYRFIYDMANGRVSGAPAKVQSDKVLWAFRSECQKSGCVATGTALDRDNAHAPLNPPLTIVLRYVDGRSGHWEGLPSKAQVLTQGPCLGPGNTVVGQAEVTNAEAWQLWPKEDGTLVGRLNATVLSNECGGQGLALTVPLTATRAGDVAPEIKVADPDIAARDLKSEPAGTPGPIFNGAVYQFNYDVSARTRGSIPAPLQPSFWSPIWTMRSECNTPTHCIATGAPNFDGQGGAVVLESAGDTWQTLSPRLLAVTCLGIPNRAAALTELSLDTSDRKAIHGTETQTILSNECGDMGAVYSTPVSVRMLDDKPAPDVQIADPALFLP